MPLQRYGFPYRVPEARLAGAYASLEAAFAERDYLYVARYARNVDPELQACALLMLGNRRGAARLLDRHNLRTSRTCLYRASAEWQIGNDDEARRWIQEGRAIGDNNAAFDRFEILMARKSFRIVFHCDDPKFAMQLKNLPGLDVVLTNHLGGEGTTIPIDGSLAAHIPPGDPVDLVLLYFVYFFPLGLEDIKAPIVAVTMGDHEWAVDSFDQKVPQIDWQAYVASSEYLQIARPFGKKGFAFSSWLSPWTNISVRGAAKRFAETAGRSIDLLFTGGIAHDIFRDKGHHVTPLAHALDPRFHVKLYEGYLRPKDHARFLRMSRFTPVSNRSTNIWGARSVDALAQGVISIAEEECGFPFLFSQNYGCFQTYRNEHVEADTASILDRYDDIVTEFLPHADELEAEAADLFPDGNVGWMRFLRNMLFVVHMDPDKNLPARTKPANAFRSLTNDRLWLALAQPAQMERLITLSRPAADAPASQWLWHAMTSATEPLTERSTVLEVIDQGLGKHPKSMALHYAKALLLRNLGRFQEAAALFSRVSDGDLILAPEDPFPGTWELLHGFYWIADMSIRELCPKDLEPLATARAVWESYALSHRADLTLRNALYLGHFAHDQQQAKAKLEETIALSRRALDKFTCTDTTQRTYLRATYALYALGESAWGDDFLQSFDAAIYTDGRIFNDCAAMAIDVLMTMGRAKEAASIKDRLCLFLERVHMQRAMFYVYPEVQPLLVRYDLPHGNIMK